MYVRDFGLCKITKSPTRGNNILDQILTNINNITKCSTLFFTRSFRSPMNCLPIAETAVS